MKMDVTEITMKDKKTLKQAQLPFKTMDIKSALMASNRKRKLADPVKDSDAKTPKITESAGIRKSEKCQSVKKWEVQVLASGVSSKPDTDVIVNGTHTPDKHELDGKSDEDMETNENDVTNGINSETDNLDTSVADGVTSELITISSDEADSSVLDNSAINASLNTSASSADLDSEPKEKSDVNQSMSDNNSKSKNSGKKVVNDFQEAGPSNTDAAALVNGKTKAVEGQSEPRKRRKMSPGEAKLKAEQRAQKQKEREEKRLEREKEKEKRLQEIQKKKEEIQKKKEELQKKKEEHGKKKEEKQKKREEEEKLKQEKKGQEEKEKLRKQQEKDEKNRQKQEKIEEKRMKEEQRLKSLEDKKRAEEEKKKAELEKEKKMVKTKAAFAGFFLKGKTSSPAQVSQSNNNDQGTFRPFQIKENMSLAPVIPKAARERFNRECLDESLVSEVSKELYLDTLRSAIHKPFRYKRIICKKVDDGDDIVILDCKENEETVAIDLCLKAKLLQFCDNIRPPYWGTWRKKSKSINSRKPFGRDEIFDYDVDSDDEWDEGGPGESLSGTEDEESEDDYEVDNEFFVPHGYLSDEEEKKDEEETATSNPEQQQVRLKMKEKEFQSERSKKTTEIKPCIVGCYWEMDSGIGNPLCLKSLQAFCAVVLVPQPIQTYYSISKSKVDDSNLLNVDRSGLGNDSVSPKTPKTPKTPNFRPVPEEAMPFLIQLLHANTNGRAIVIKEFQEFWEQHICTLKDNSPEVGSDTTAVSALSPALNKKSPADNNQSVITKPPNYKISGKQLSRTIREISDWIKCPDSQLKRCWWVNEKMREKYGLLDLSVPNKWVYVTRKEVENTSPVTPNTPSIKDLYKVLGKGQDNQEN